MKILTGIAALSIIATSGVALAQSVEAPAPVSPTVQPGVQPDRPVSPDLRATDTSQARPGTVDPNRTGPDVVSGLEVPKMKDPRDGGRE